MPTLPRPKPIATPRSSARCATRESAVAKAQADQERVLAETLSLAKQAEAQRDLEIKKAQYLEVTKRQQAQADKAYDIQTNIMQQQVIAEQVKVQQIEKEQQVKVQEAEINRREKELIATVLKQARDRASADRNSGRCREAAPDRGSRRPGVLDSRARRGRSRNHLQERRSRSQGDERESRSFPGIQPGGGDRQAVRQHAGDREGVGRSAGQRRQDHHRLHRKRR